MMKPTHAASVAIIAAVMAAPALAANIKHGERLAKQWCGNCHVIGTEQSTGGDTAPTFASIAETAAGRTDELNVWLAGPHPPHADSQPHALRDR